MYYHSRKYIKLIEWIALNDNDGETDPIDALAGYLTVKMLADCYNLKPSQVAEDVFAFRQNNGGAL